MIRFDDMTKETTVQFLKQTLNKILHDDMLYTPDSQSMAIKLLADLSIKNYQALNDDIELAIETFQKLRQRI